MADNDFLVVEANGNLHHQPELNDEYEDPMSPAETLLQQVNSHGDLDDDADDNTEAVQAVPEPSAASNHGVQGDRVDDNPGYLQEEDSAAAPVIEIAHNIYLPLLSREDVEFIMSLP